MATIKSFTDLSQSQTLSKIIPLESADMYYEYIGIPVVNVGTPNYNENGQIVPCWSLSALLSLIRETIGYTIYGVNNVYMSCDLGDKPWKLETEVYDNEVDACVAMIEKLHEQNLL